MSCVFQQKRNLLIREKLFFLEFLKKCIHVISVSGFPSNGNKPVEGVLTEKLSRYGILGAALGKWGSRVCQAHYQFQMGR